MTVTKQACVDGSDARYVTSAATVHNVPLRARRRGMMDA